MRWNPRPGGRACRLSAGTGRGPAGRDRPRTRPERVPYIWPDTSEPLPGHAAAHCPAGGEPAEGVVRVRFTPSDVPVLTRCPAGRAAAIQGAAEALARLGCSYLGGNLEVISGTSRRAAAEDERLAAARAVENVLRGGCGFVQIPPPRRWPVSPGCSGTGGCPCPATT